MILLLFSLGSALLDVEKALNIMEKAAELYYKQYGHSVVLIINNVQALAHDQGDVLELLQQRAEGWAAQQIATVVFVSDEYIVYDRLRKCHVIILSVFNVRLRD